MLITFSASFDSLNNRFCDATGIARADVHVSSHVLPGVAIRSDK
jgi:hypothetical protein